MDDEGLTPGVAAERFREWRVTHRWPLVAVLAPRLPMDEARATVQELRPPAHLRLALDPALPDLLEPVVTTLARHGLDANPAQLATDPLGELARVAGHGSVAQLEAAVATYSDSEAWKRELRARAAHWRDVLIDLAILAQLPADTTRAHLRDLDAAMQEKLPYGAQRPSDLQTDLDVLFPEHAALVIELADELVDDVVGPRPTLEQVRAMAVRHGLPLDRHGELVAARGTSRRRVERLQQRGDALRDAQVQPTVPAGLQTVPPPQPVDPGKVDGEPGPRPVRRVKVDPSTDHRKRKTGDEGEQWALAATLASLTSLDPHARERAIDELSSFLERHFGGAPVTELLEHGVRARAVVDDDEEYLEHASRLLHVSAVSDAFGFDVLGWVSTTDNQDPAPVCLEVKSTGSDTFHLSAGEWRRAKEYHDMDSGQHYAVLVVVRSPKGGAPARMDLLPDPVALVENEQLQQSVDGYNLRYRTG